MIKYIIDVVVESHKGRHDFKELIERIEVNGKLNAVEIAGEVDWYMANVAKIESAVFFYRADKAPELNTFAKVSI